MPYPHVQGGGSLILAWQVRNKRVLVVGGGDVAAGRILHLLNADALITLVAPSVNPEVAHRIATHGERITHVARAFEPSDLDDPALSMVLTAIDDPDASSAIYKLCKEKRIAVNVADVPPECDFYFGSTHRDGPLQIMVSTNGNGPKLASLVRKRIAASLPANLAVAITRVGALRRRLRRAVPGQDEGLKRMAWMSRVCETWTLEELCEMTDADMEALLGFYKSNAVPSFNQVRGGDDEEPFGFDGSFGWSCVI